MERLRRLNLNTDVRTAIRRRQPSRTSPQRWAAHNEIIVPPNAITPDSTVLTPDDAAADRALPERHRSHPRPGPRRPRQYPGHLCPLAPAGRHPLPSPAGHPRGSRTCSSARWRFPIARCWIAICRPCNRSSIVTTSCALPSSGKGCPRRRRWSCVRRPCTSPRSSSIRDGAAASEQLARRFDPRHHRIDLTQAPLLRFVIAHEPGQRALAARCNCSITSSATTPRWRSCTPRCAASCQGTRQSLSAPSPSATSSRRRGSACRSRA